MKGRRGPRISELDEAAHPESSPRLMAVHSLIRCCSLTEAGAAVVTHPAPTEGFPWLRRGWLCTPCRAAMTSHLGNLSVVRGVFRHLQPKSADILPGPGGSWPARPPHELQSFGQRGRDGAHGMATCRGCCRCSIRYPFQIFTCLSVYY